MPGAPGESPAHRLQVAPACSCHKPPVRYRSADRVSNCHPHRIHTNAVNVFRGEDSLPVFPSRCKRIAAGLASVVHQVHLRPSEASFD